MGDLFDFYREEAQPYKDIPWEPPPLIAERISHNFKSQMGREATPDEMKAAISGIGWTVRMALEHDLDMDDLMAIAQDIEENVRGNLRTDGFSKADRISLGVGAGFFTGILLVLKLAQHDGH